MVWDILQNEAGEKAHSGIKAACLTGEEGEGQCSGKTQTCPALAWKQLVCPCQAPWVAACRLAPLQAVQVSLLRHPAQVWGTQASVVRYGMLDCGGTLLG